MCREGLKGSCETKKKKTTKQTHETAEVHGTDRLCPVLTYVSYTLIFRTGASALFRGRGWRDDGVFSPPFEYDDTTGGNAGREVINKYARSNQSSFCLPYG